MDPFERILPNKAQVQEIAARPVQFSEVHRVLTIPQSPAIGIVTVQSTAAVELKVGGSALASRSVLRVRNPDPSIPVRIGGSAITESTVDLLEPFETIEILLDKTVPVSIYGRSTGYEVSLEVMES